MDTLNISIQSIEDDQMNRISSEKRTSPEITKYEKTKAISIRAQQIAMGSPSTVEIGDLRTAVAIAEKEYEENKIPLIVRRYLPDGTYEDWKISEMLDLN